MAMVMATAIATEPFKNRIKDLYGETGLKWLSGLPKTLEKLKVQWSFTEAKPLPHLSYHFVAEISGLDPTQWPKVETAILKIGPLGSNIPIETKWLKTFSKDCPKVYRENPDLAVFAMENINPGQSLKHELASGKVTDQLATQLLCASISKLHKKKRKNQGFSKVFELSRSLYFLRGIMDSSLLDKCINKFDKLSKSEESRWTCLHGDLHHDNLLKSGKEWKVIDPHGYFGHPGFEIGAMIFNEIPAKITSKNLKALLDQRIQTISESLGFNQKMVTDWCFVRTMISLGWTAFDHGPLPKQETEIARYLGSQ